MTAETQRNDGVRPASTLRIEGEMTIYQAADLKQVLLAWIDQYMELDIDLSAVTEIDTAGLQLLVAAKKTAQARNKPLRLTARSDAVADAFGLLDMDGCFGESPVISSNS